MKKVLLVLFAMGWFLGCFAQEIKFDAIEHDFGNINYRDPAEYKFVFTNTGTEPLIIQKARAKWGYTVCSWTKEIMPGGKGDIEVKPNPGYLGPIDNSITVTSNAKNSPQMILKVKGCVWPKGMRFSQKNGYWGCEDDKGMIIIQYQYDQIGWGGRKDNDECFIKIKKGGKWGIADKTGVVIPCEYDGEFSFNEAMRVKKVGKWGVIDNNNKVIVPFEYVTEIEANKALEEYKALQKE